MNRIIKIAYPEQYDIAAIIEARRSAALEYVTTLDERKRELALRTVEYYDNLLIEFLNLATLNAKQMKDEEKKNT